MRRRGNEKFIWLRVPKALLTLPGALGFKLQGRGGGSQPERWWANTHVKEATNGVATYKSASRICSIT